MPKWIDWKSAGFCIGMNGDNFNAAGYDLGFRCIVILYSWIHFGIFWGVSWTCLLPPSSWCSFHQGLLGFGGCASCRWCLWPSWSAGAQQWSNLQQIWRFYSFFLWETVVWCMIFLLNMYYYWLLTPTKIKIQISIQLGKIQGHLFFNSISSIPMPWPVGASPTLPGAHARLCTTFTRWIGLGWGGSSCMKNWCWKVPEMECCFKKSCGTSEKMWQWKSHPFHHQVPVGEEAKVNFKLNNSSSSVHHRFA